MPKTKKPTPPVVDNQIRRRRLLKQGAGAPDTLCFRVRAALGLSQLEFAKYLRKRTGGTCAENTVQRWERRKMVPGWAYQRELDELARDIDAHERLQIKRIESTLSSRGARRKSA